MLNQPQAVSTTGSELDPQAVNLAKAIRQSESGGNFTAKGASGEFGAYQFTKDTWNKTSQKYGINAEFGKATPEQQNQAAYSQIKEWKDKGYNPGQIASMWNAGEGESDAYLGKFSDGSPAMGTNKQGVKFNVPQYAKSVAQAYQTLKGGGSVSVDPANPSSTAAPQESTIGKIGGFLGGLAKNITEPVATLLARPYQAASMLINPNQTDEQLAKVPLLSNIYGDIPIPKTGQDLLKDVGRGAQTVALGLPVGTIPKAIGMGALAGAGAGLEEKGNLSGALTGGLIGGAIGGVGGGISKALEALPGRITQSAFGKMSPEQIQQTLATKNIGTKAGLLSQSETAISDLGNQLGRIIEQPKYATLKVKATDVLSKLAENPQIKQNLLDTGFYLDDIAKQMKGVVKLKSGLVDKFFNEGLTFKELQTLNSALGKNTYKSVFDAPAVRAGKDLANTMYHGISDVIKTTAPESIPIFDQLSKEYGVRTAIEKVAKKSTGGIIKWSDVIPFMTGTALGGGNPLVGFGAAIGQRALTNPAVQFAGAKAIQGVAKSTVPIVSRAGLLPTLLNKTP